MLPGFFWCLYGYIIRFAKSGNLAFLCLHGKSILQKWQPGFLCVLWQIHFSKSGCLAFLDVCNANLLCKKWQPGFLDVGMANLFCKNRQPCFLDVYMANLFCKKQQLGFLRCFHGKSILQKVATWPPPLAHLTKNCNFPIMCRWWPILDKHSPSLPPTYAHVAHTHTHKYTHTQTR